MKEKTSLCQGTEKCTNFVKTVTRPKGTQRTKGHHARHVKSSQKKIFKEPEAQVPKEARQHYAFH
jgi:hypothetical protein